MIIAIGLFYFIIFLACVTASLFIVFHLARYSYDKKTTAVLLIIFISVTGILMFANIILFLSLRLDRIFPAFLNGSI